MSRLHSGADAMAALLGGPAVAGEESERRRTQNAALDDFLRRHNVDPATTMRIDPATAGRSLDAIMAAPAPKGEVPASAAKPATPAEIGPAPQMSAGAGSLPVNFTPSDAMIGAGINVRDNEQTQVAKMGLKRQHEAAGMEAAAAAQRNQVAGRQVDAALFDTRSRGWSEFEKMMAGERKGVADADQFGRKLDHERALAEMIQKGKADEQRFAVGPEMTKAARQAAIYKAFAENPAQAQQFLDALLRFESGAPMVPAGAAPGQSAAGKSWWDWGGSSGPAPSAPAAGPEMSSWQKFGRGELVTTDDLRGWNPFAGLSAVGGR